MVQSSKHIKPLVLWIGILTALLLIFSTFFGSANPLSHLEFSNNLIDQFPVDKMKSITTMVKDTLQRLYF